jgi:membrane protein DedA with SNARE-associated domain
MSFSLVGSVVELVILVLGALGLPGLFTLTAVEGFGVPPIPSEVILPFAGFLVAQGTYPFYGAVVAAVLGELVGAYAAYAVGRRWRHRIERIGVGALRLEPKHLESMDRFFARRGEATVALARLIPVVRSYISYPAGTSKMPAVRFGAYTVAGLLPFEIAFLYLGVVLRSHWSEIESLFGWFDYAALGIVVIAGIYLYLVLTERVVPGWPPRRADPKRPPRVVRP